MLRKLQRAQKEETFFNTFYEHVLKLSFENYVISFPKTLLGPKNLKTWEDHRFEKYYKTEIYKNKQHYIIAAENLRFYDDCDSYNKILFPFGGRKYHYNKNPFALSVHERKRLRLNINGFMYMF